jgi:hypothetical protein
MSMQNVTHMFDRYEDAADAVRALEAAGFSHDDVSLVANQNAARASNPATAAEVNSDLAAHSSTAVGTGASVGTILGGGAGLLAGIGALAIPGVSFR